ncbi:HAD family hydrolase [bacterium]|nr:HAD family hydrolase [bacterium]
MKIDLIIFDCDGVLVDSEPVSNKILAEELTKIGLPTTSKESIRNYMGKSEHDNLEEIKKKLGHLPPEAFFESCHKRTFESFKRDLKPVFGITEALRRLPQKKCVASSGSHDKIRYTLGLTNLLPFFIGSIFSAMDVNRGKPHPDLFLHAAEMMGSSPESCVVIEDSLPGVQAGIAAGMKVFGYAAMSAAEDLIKAGATAFTEMKQLPELLQLDSADRQD